MKSEGLAKGIAKDLDPYDKIIRLAYLILALVAIGAVWTTTITIKTDNLDDRVTKIEAQMQIITKDVTETKNDVKWIVEDLKKRP